MRTVGNPKVSVPQATREFPLVPPTETATSARDQSFRDHWIKVRRTLFVDNSQPTMPVSSTPPIQNPVSNPLFLEVSDKFWSLFQELLDKVIPNSF